ncbi:hypothetical protein FS749_002319 [Ceratobasidium sp. UAMH 11750]|nr:hypothetical protein FS749_002319 [Ceratobasidium sp. UAMH 11750]
MPLPPTFAPDSPMLVVLPPYLWCPPFESEDFECLDFLPGYLADLAIHTRDSKTLFAHRAVLAFASGPLANLIHASPNGMISFGGESSGAVRALLEWVYPHTSMRIADFDALDGALGMAEKYQLGAMRDALRGLVYQPSSAVNIRLHPVQAYGIAISHGFTSEAREAARLAVGKVDFRREGVLEELKSMGVGAEGAFRLMQRQLAWESVLADVLLGSSRPSCSELILEEREWNALVCPKCASWDEDNGPTEMVQWQRIWAEKVYERLVCTPLQDCAYVFRPDYVTRSWSEGCERCMIRLMRNQGVLDDWMGRVWEVLNQKWDGIFGGVW